MLQRTAFALWFWAKVSVLQVTSAAVWAGVQAVLLNPVFDEESQMELLCRDVLPRL